MSAIFPISYWGSILYFHELVQHSFVQLEVHETFPKQTHRNRFEIVTSNGVLQLTAPVTKPNGNKSKTHEIELITDKVTLQKNWRAITSAYASSPFFEHYELDLEHLFLEPKTNLVEQVFEINKFLFSCWGLEISVERTISYNWQLQNETLQKDYLAAKDLDWKLYQQVMFSSKTDFVSNTSALDLLCNLGPLGRDIILFPFY